MSARGASPVPPVDRVFAYGTLMTGFSRRPLLGGAIPEGPARIRGTLYHFGDYPGLVLDDGAWVHGELYRVPDLGARFTQLDRAEWCDPDDEAGSLYVRCVVPVRSDHVADTAAWVYAYNERFGRARGRGPRVDSGDWRAYVTAGALR